MICSMTHTNGVPISQYETLLRLAVMLYDQSMIVPEDVRGVGLVIKNLVNQVTVCINCYTSMNTLPFIISSVQHPHRSNELVLKHLHQQAVRKKDQERSFIMVLTPFKLFLKRMNRLDHLD